MQRNQLKGDVIRDEFIRATQNALIIWTCNGSNYRIWRCTGHGRGFYRKSSSGGKKLDHLVARISSSQSFCQQELVKNWYQWLVSDPGVLTQIVDIQMSSKFQISYLFNQFKAETEQIRTQKSNKTREVWRSPIHFNNYSQLIFQDNWTVSIWWLKYMLE